MTREEIVQGLYRGDGRAIKEAIKTLEQEPCKDAISRKAVDELSRNLVHVTRDKADFLCNFWEGLQKLPSVTPTHKWIPCSERLPDTPHYYEEDEFRESDFILIYTKINDIENESNIYVAQYCIDDGDKTGYFVVPFCGDTFREGVTAWMPLPEPYKAESEE